MDNLITIELGSLEFQLQEHHDFSWLENMGEVFCVFDEQDSGNISFGLKRDNQKFFVKYAGAKPMEYNGNPEDAVNRLKEAIPVYQTLDHPHLIKLVDHFKTTDGFAAVFEWFNGECLHAHWSFGGIAKYTNPASPFYRFKRLPISKRLEALDRLFSFHSFVESQGYVAVDFYDGSILYNFENDEAKICDIDFYQKSPSVNDMGESFWGADRSKSPEEYKLGAPIDSITNVYNLGAIAFGLLGGETDHSFSKWEADENQYYVAIKATSEDRDARFLSVKEFYQAWQNV
ncbi:protein kinase family protein [Pontibacillus marinus]|uniref:serine/threonine protein kinase n=1 Tax=Pontibacillus marinus TaxID=273164 RepID=UPI0004228F6F|nr:serine/threonine protein kinase [Pontibacillus marinus]